MAIDLPLPLNHSFALFCYEREYTVSYSNDNTADVIAAFNSTSRYLDDLLSIDNSDFEGMVNQIFPPEILIKLML